ncbi:MAG: hypothetical protein ACM3ZE_23960 [Myxococcales bacterium]
MNSVSLLRSPVLEAGIGDILVPGYVEPDVTLAVFHADYNFVYLELGGTFLELATIETTGTMRLSLSAELAHPLDLDDGMAPAFASLREQCLDDTESGNCIEEVVVWGATEQGGDAVCSALQFKLHNGQLLFIDPTYHFGIRIGGQTQRKIWEDNCPNLSELSVDTVGSGHR